jgi:hypothetical protein
MEKQGLVHASRAKAAQSLSVLALLCTLGCGTPMAVKHLSAEQVKVQNSYLGALKAYFKVIEEFADAQLKASNFRLDDIAKKAAQDETNEALKPVAAAQDDASRRKILGDLANNVQDTGTAVVEQKHTNAELVAKLKAKHKEMLEAYQNILDAQQKLDDYIQLEKADEVLVNQLVGVVGVNKDRITQSVTDIANIEGQIEKAFKAGVVEQAP